MKKIKKYPVGKSGQYCQCGELLTADGNCPKSCTKQTVLSDQNEKEDNHGNVS
jgi:hypothetical protein